MAFTAWLFLIKSNIIRRFGPNPSLTAWFETKIEGVRFWCVLLQVLEEFALCYRGLHEERESSSYAFICSGDGSSKEQNIEIPSLNSNNALPLHCTANFNKSHLAGFRQPHFYLVKLLRQKNRMLYCNNHILVVFYLLI